MKTSPFTTLASQSGESRRLRRFAGTLASLAVSIVLFSCDSAPTEAGVSPGTEKAAEPVTPPPAPQPPAPAGTGTTGVSKGGKEETPAPQSAAPRYRPRGAPRSDAPDDVVPGTPTGAESSKEYHTVGVYYGTNRKPTGSPGPNGFYGKERHREGPVGYGKIEVSIPLHHTIGVVERPKWYKLEFSEDPKKHVVLLKIEPLEREAFFTRVKESSGDGTARQALLFIHGYNVSFDSAIQRTAQIAFDLDFHGVPIAFSWPSQSSLGAYTIDQENAIWSVPHLSRFLIDLQEQTGIEEINIIAHSMGTRVLTQALANARDEGFSLKLNNIILAAPDIDADVFKEQILPKISGSAAKLTMYSSSSDSALKVSQKIHGNDRLGLGGPNLQVLNGIDTVNASGIDTSLLGHAYYGSHRLVVRDILNLVIRHLDPPERDLVRGPVGAWDFKPEQPDTEAEKGKEE